MLILGRYGAPGNELALEFAIVRDVWQILDVLFSGLRLSLVATGLVTSLVGAVGVMNITLVVGRLLPLIHYDFTDRAVLADGPHPEDLRFPCLERVNGRREDNFRYANGVAVHPAALHGALADLNLDAYQFCQTEHGLRARIEASRCLELESIRRRLAEALWKAGLRLRRTVRPGSAGRRGMEVR